MRTDDRDSSIGTLDTAWGEAVEKEWLIVGMKDGWNRIFPFAE
jgi:hypothetical protein